MRVTCRVEFREPVMRGSVALAGVTREVLTCGHILETRDYATPARRWCKACTAAAEPRTAEARLARLLASVQDALDHDHRIRQTLLDALERDRLASGVGGVEVEA